MGPSYVGTDAGVVERQPVESELGAFDLGVTDVLRRDDLLAIQQQVHRKLLIAVVVQKRFEVGLQPVTEEAVLDAEE